MARGVLWGRQRSHFGGSVTDNLVKCMTFEESHEIKSQNLFELASSGKMKNYYSPKIKRNNIL